MCGIAGWNLTEKASDSFYSTLAAVMQDRGEESYGIFADGKITKGTGAILEELPAKAMATLAGFLHTRHATHGKVKAANAHPFERGNLIGAHNGVLWNHSELNQKYTRTNAVDSMHIFDHISQGLPLDDINGYGAIEFFRNGQYFVGCCNHGDLEIALTSIGVVWASTARAIHSAIKQASIELVHFYKIEEGKIYRIESDSVYETEETFQLSYSRPVDPKAKTDWRDFKSSSNSSMSALDRDFVSTWERGEANTSDDPRAGLDISEEEFEIEMEQEFAEMLHEDGACEFCGKQTEVAAYIGSKICARCYTVVQ